MASSMFTSIMEAPPSIWLRATSSASSYAPLAIRRANFLEPATLVRSPMFVKMRTSRSQGSGSSPESQSLWSLAGHRRGAMPRSASLMALMCRSSVPQHPPAMFSNPDSAICRMWRAVYSGISSYCPISLGSPALGYIDKGMGIRGDNCSMNCLSSVTPKEQFRPKLTRRE